MKYLSFLLTVFLFIVSASAQSDTARFRQIIEQKIQNESFSGTVLIAEKGVPVLQVSSGFQDFDRKKPIQNDTKFAVASITKTVTAIVVLQLVQEGKLQLTDRLSTLLPEFNLPKSDSITVHHLLLHISGLPNEPGSIYKKTQTEKGLVQTVARTEKANTYGLFNYNNLDYVLLGLVIEKRSGVKWQTAVQQRVIDKLGLRNTGFLRTGNLPVNFASGYLISAGGKAIRETPFHIENFYAAGNMYSNAQDLLKLDQSLYTNTLLTEESKKLMYTSYPAYNYTGYSVWTYNYPFAASKPKIMERRGGIYGSNSVLVRFLDNNKTLIVLSNNDAFNPDSFGDKSNLREQLIVELAKDHSAVKNDTALLAFANELIGNFSSKQQSERDTAYFNISLSMSRIWPDRTDGIWLYVEQAVATNKTKPYRQRVYKLTHPSKDVFSSEIFTINNAQEVIGLQNDASLQGKLTLDKIEAKDGCTVLLTYANGKYEGGTQGNNCPSDLRGAKYATTKIKLSPGVLESWDQGFDASGKQVWGAVKGGYVFVRE